MIPLMIVVATAVGLAEGSDPSSTKDSSRLEATQPVMVAPSQGPVAEQAWAPEANTVQEPAKVKEPLNEITEKEHSEPSIQVAALQPADRTLALVGESSRPAPELKWQLTIEDQRLDVALNRWAEKAGYSLRWDAERYVLIGAKTTYYGSFKQALNDVLQSPGLKYSEYPLEACIYANNPPLVRITKLGDQTQECK